jgi:RimJ/RimL family protein N-acetyltransferase
MTIRSDRLDLVALPRGYLERVLDGRPRPDLGFADPEDFLAGADDVVQLRLEQLIARPSLEPWLLRAVVLRSEGIAVGFCTFHDEPDDRGVVELGYEIAPVYRRQGFAREVARALAAWAATHGAGTLRASISPDNAASIALVEGEGFVQIGEQIDDDDGLELVYEKPLY